MFGTEVARGFLCRARKRATYEMSEVVLFRNRIPSDEMIAKPVKAGYLRSDHQHDPNAVTTAIAHMKRDLRKNGNTTKAR